MPEENESDGCLNVGNSETDKQNDEGLDDDYKTSEDARETTSETGNEKKEKKKGKNVVESLGQNVIVNPEDQNNDRRKSFREIKMTPKLVDMIATSSSHKRIKRTTSIKDDVNASQVLSSKEKNTETEFEYSNLIRKATGCEDQDEMDENDEPEQSGEGIENYLQSKMDENASNFECNWEPGDLVWARFAGELKLGLKFKNGRYFQMFNDDYFEI